MTDKKIVKEEIIPAIENLVSELNQTSSKTSNISIFKRREYCVKIIKDLAQTNMLYLQLGNNKSIPLNEAIKYLA